MCPKICPRMTLSVPWNLSSICSKLFPLTCPKKCPNWCSEKYRCVPKCVLKVDYKIFNSPQCKFEKLNDKHESKNKEPAGNLNLIRANNRLFFECVLFCLLHTDWNAGLLFKSNKKTFYWKPTRTWCQAQLREASVWKYQQDRKITSELAEKKAFSLQSY